MDSREENYYKEETCYTCDNHVILSSEFEDQDQLLVPEPNIPPLVILMRIIVGVLLMYQLGDMFCRHIRSWFNGGGVLSFAVSSHGLFV